MVVLLGVVNAILVLLCLALLIAGRPYSGFSGETFTLLYEERFDGFELWTAEDQPADAAARNAEINLCLREWLTEQGLIGSAPVRITIGRPG